jgi:hypothetical protein
MRIARRLVPALILAAAVGASGASWSAEPEVATTAPPTSAAAPASTPPAAAPASSVADQIDTYLKTSPAAVLPKDATNGVTPGDEPRKAHGFVDVTVGSGGYRSALVESELPVGKTGTLSIAVGESRFNGRAYGGYGGAYGGYGGGYAPGQRQTLGLGLRLGGEASGDSQDLRCRQGGDDVSDPRFDGSRLRPCHTAEAPSSPQ